MSCDQADAITADVFWDNFRRKAREECIPLYGGIELTNRCNLQCVHCYINTPHAREAGIVHELPTKEILRILDEAADAGCLFLFITGGEPLLRKDFHQIYRHAKSKGIHVTVYTNGTLITDETVELFKEYPPQCVEISIYGTSEETYKRVTGVTGAFQAFKDGVKKLREAGTQLQLKTVLLSQNQHELNTMKAIADESGASFRLGSTLVSTIYEEEHPTLHSIDPEIIINSEFEDRDIAESHRMTYGNWLRKATEAKHQETADGADLFQCDAARTTFFVDASGCLRPCQAERNIGADLKTITFIEGWAQIGREIRAFKQPKEFPCTSCNYRAFCVPCPSKFYTETGHYDTPFEYMCRVARCRVEKVVEMRSRRDEQ